MPIDECRMRNSSTVRHWRVTRSAGLSVPEPPLGSTRFRGWGCLRGRLQALQPDNVDARPSRSFDERLIQGRKTQTLALSELQVGSVVGGQGVFLG